MIERSSATDMSYSLPPFITLYHNKSFVVDTDGEFLWRILSSDCASIHLMWHLCWPPRPFSQIYWPGPWKYWWQNPDGVRSADVRRIVHNSRGSPVSSFGVEYSTAEGVPVSWSELSIQLRRALGELTRSWILNCQGHRVSSSGVEY
jgi:hypothetical protein